MSLIRINTRPSRSQLRAFGFAWLLIFGFWGANFWLHGKHPVALWFWAVATGVSFFGFLFPKGLRLLYLGMTYATYPIGFVISPVILAIVYFLVLTPIGAILRWCGYDPLFRAFDAKASSYWTRRALARPPESYLRQS